MNFFNRERTSLARDAHFEYDNNFPYPKRFLLYPIEKKNHFFQFQNFECSFLEIFKHHI